MLKICFLRRSKCSRIQSKGSKCPVIEKTSINVVHYNIIFFFDSSFYNVFKLIKLNIFLHFRSKRIRKDQLKKKMNFFKSKLLTNIWRYTLKSKLTNSHYYLNEPCENEKRPKSNLCPIQLWRKNFRHRGFGIVYFCILHFYFVLS